MERKYGEEQRAAVINIKEVLINKIEQIYLDTFETLNNQGLGDGTIARLTQELLLSRQAAIEILKGSSNK